MKNKYLILVVVFFVVAAPSVALGNTVALENTTQLLEKCKLAIVVTTNPSELENTGFSSGADLGFCFGYLRGMSDAALAAQLDPDSLEAIKSCRPPDVDNGQLARVLIKFLEDDPEFLHYGMIFATALALNQAFPCE
jgi:hypothetical protein